MKLKFLILIALLVSIATFSQDFGTIASGIKIQNTIYNISSNSASNAINSSITAQNFEAVNLGTFGQNSTCALITGAEIKTFKNASSNVCTTVLNWRVYATGAPSGVYNAIALTSFSDCDLGTNTYFDGIGPCAAGDQKWKDYSLTTNFAAGLTAGNYVLETYFSYTGSNVSTNTCETTKVLDNAGLFYKANFTIANPTATATALPSIVCDGSNLTLSATVLGGVAPFTYAWTGPNGFTSALASPVIVANLLTTGGIYSVIVTDSCGVSTLSAVTNGVNVIARIVPTFETVNPSYCRKVLPPVPPILPILPVPPLIPAVQLPNTSTEGIDGAWSLNGLFNDNLTIPATPLFINNDPPYAGTIPPLVQTIRYYFYPNASECGTNTFVDIDIRRNTSPTFGFPLTYCIGAVVPNLPSNSTNSVGGTWSNVLGAPVTKINTAVAGTFQYNFSPNPGLCALQRAFIITITPKKVPTFTLPTFVCAGGAVPLLPLQSEDTPPISGTWSPQVVSNTTTQTYTFNAVGICVDNKVLTITVNPVIIPTFDPIADICKNRVATALPTQSTNVPPISGTWSGSINTAVSGLQTFTFTPTSNPCSPTAQLLVNIIEPLDPIFDIIPPICKGTAAIDTPVLPSSSNNVPSISGTWFPPNINTTTSGSYTFTPTGSICANTKTINVVIKDPIVPTFDPIAPLCIGDASPAFPITTNVPLINGTWSPPGPINTATAGTFTYTFNPTPGQCASPKDIVFTIKNKLPTIIPPVADICIGTTPAPALPQPTNVPTVTGIWSPLVIDTSVAGTFPYTFTPNGVSCADVQTIQVKIINPSEPTFAPFSPICQFGIAPVLPLQSTNIPPIFGQWSPPIDTSIIGTTQYLFTPNSPGQCATPKSFGLTVIEKKTPLFAPVSICQGATTPTGLPTTSLNNISGSWSPVLDVNTLGFTTYTFTPNGNECAFNTTLNVEITPKIINPTFNAFPILCVETTGYSLPTTSSNGIVGVWSPALSTATVGDIEYTFAPNAGQCAKDFKVTITVKTQDILPTFNSLGDLCNVGAVPALPETSSNGIQGTWIPLTIDNSILGITNYAFTPNVGQCALPRTLAVNVVNSGRIPTFAAITPICKNNTAPPLPLQSNNSVPIQGTWSFNAVVVTTIDTSAVGTFTYTFNPSANQCAVSTTIQVTIVTESIIPVFNSLPTSICQRNNPITLPNISNNTGGAITGTWSPSPIVNTTTLGPTTYTFNPAVNQCALPFPVVITITAPTLLSTFTPISVCKDFATAPDFPQTSLENSQGTWSPSVISTSASGTYNFSPNGNQCALPGTLTVNVFAPNITPTFTQIAPICQGNPASSFVNTSLNGITGTWNLPINTSAIGFTTYTFKPNAGQCATDYPMIIEITAPTIDLTFPAVANICLNGVAPTLPQPTNVPTITGNWTSAINTSGVGTTVYEFMPTSGQCAKKGLLSVTIDAPVQSIINPIANVCKNTIAPALPTISNNAVPIAGTWFPLTINTTTTGTSIYTFTPRPEFCALPTTISITIDEPIVSTFDPITNTRICKNGIVPILPTTSLNGIQGTWTPTATVSNTLIGTTVYTFNPASGICATKPTVSINVYEPTVEPTFDTVGLSICAGKSVPILPPTSTNGFAGIWTPDIVNANATGTYKFVPTIGLCVKDKTITITYVPEITSEFRTECINANYNLFLTAVGNAFNANNTFTWKDETGTVISNGNSTTLNVTNYIESTTRNESFPLTYKVEIKTPEGCESNETFTIDNAYCEIQKGISPNGDNKNDYFDLSNYNVSHFSIFNRYGIKVYHKTDYKTEWIGQTDSGETLPDGTYFYNIEFNNNEIKTGWVYINK